MTLLGFPSGQPFINLFLSIFDGGVVSPAKTPSQTPPDFKCAAPYYLLPSADIQLSFYPLILYNAISASPRQPPKSPVHGIRLSFYALSVKAAF